MEEPSAQLLSAPTTPPHLHPRLENISHGSSSLFRSLHPVPFFSSSTEPPQDGSSPSAWSCSRFRPHLPAWKVRLLEGASAFIVIWFSHRFHDDGWQGKRGGGGGVCGGGSGQRDRRAAGGAEGAWSNVFGSIWPGGGGDGPLCAPTAWRLADLPSSCCVGGRSREGGRLGAVRPTEAPSGKRGGRFAARRLLVVHAVQLPVQTPDLGSVPGRVWRSEMIDSWRSRWTKELTGCSSWDGGGGGGWELKETHPGAKNRT